MNLPCRAKVVTYEPADGVGSLELEGSQQVRFGASACLGFTPAIGIDCWLIETKPNPVGGGVRAKTVNLTGIVEPDRRTQLEAATRRAEEWKARERDLLEVFGFESIRTLSYRAVANLGTEAHARLARTLVEWKRQGHLFDELFTLLVSVSPESFHPFLAEMDPKREPESLAFVNAPMDAVGPLIRLLDGAAAPSRVPLEVGTVSRALDAHRDMSAAGNDAGGALLALVRSCQPDALEAVTSWFKTASTEAADEAAGLLFYDGFCVAADGGVVRMHSVAAYELRPAPEEKKGGLLARGLRAFGARPPRDAYGDLWGAEKATCNACRAPLLLVLRIATSAIPNVLPPECGDELVIFTCRNCVAVDFDPYYVRLGPTLESVFAEAPPDNFEPEVRHEPGALRPVKVVPAPAPTRIDYLSAKTSEITRVGGAPSWVQSARAVPCPVCDSVMRFIGQIADPPGEAWSNGDSGALYAFLCGPCRIVGTIVQHT